MTDTTQNPDTDRRTAVDHYEHTFDPATGNVTEELVLAVAAVTNSNPTTLNHLSDTLDPDALDAIFSTPDGGTRRLTERRLRFEYEGYHVQITADGTIMLDSN
jgi:hypothetical protein